MFAISAYNYTPVAAIARTLPSSVSIRSSDGRFSIVNNVKGGQISVLIDPIHSGGAITSLTYKGVEYVDAFDHGRLIQSAVTLDGLGECLNPTEAGTSTDGHSSNTSSRLLLASTTPNSITTTTRAAYWLAPGERYGAPCGPGTTVKVAQNATILSSYDISRTLSFGEPAIPNLIKSEITFKLPENRAKGVFEALTGYLPADFDTFLSYDLNTQTLKPLSWTRLERLTTEPIIVARANGTASLGVVSPMIDKDGAERSYYAYFYSPEPSATAKWACVFEKTALSAGTQAIFDCDFALGDVDEVISALNSFQSKTAKSAMIVPIFGFYRGSKHLYALSYTEGARAGLSFDKTAFHVQQSASPKSQALYRCYAPDDDDHYASLRQDCEGTRDEGLLGFVQSVPGDGLVPLYRFYKRGSRTHLITVDYSEGTLNGFILEQKLGYVRP